MDHSAIQLSKWGSIINGNMAGSITDCGIPVEELRTILLRSGFPERVELIEDRLYLSLSPKTAEGQLIATIPAFLPEYLGDDAFKSTYGTRYALYTGAMANGISSEDLVIAMGKAGMMGSFGAGGLLPERIEKAIQKIKSALPDGPYAFNLINSPNEPVLEEKAAELYIRHGINVIEASAYLGLTCKPGLVSGFRIK